MSSGSQKVDTSFSRKPTFDFPGSRGLADSLLDRTNQTMFNEDNIWREQGLSFLSDIVAGKPIEWQPSQELQNQITSVQDSAAMALPEQLANARSQYYRAPSGRQAMGIDDAVNRNQVAMNSQISDLMQKQYNIDTGIMGNAANNLIQTDASDFAQSMQLLKALTGEKGHGMQATSGTPSTGSMLAGLGSIVGGVAAFSDRRLKTNIEEVGTWMELPLYAFEYVFDRGRRLLGCMADEVRKQYPEAVLDLGVYDMVNYRKIVDMQNA